MAALSVIPHSPTGEQPPILDQLHPLLLQLDDSELAALAILIADRFPVQQISTQDAIEVLLLASSAKREDSACLVNALAEFDLLALVLRAVRLEGSADHVAR